MPSRLHPHPAAPRCHRKPASRPSRFKTAAISREKKAPAKVLTREGGYSDNKKDPGGPTMKGVHGGRSARRNRDPARH
ncbi:glycosyl hydrolase 108 family protein [Mesorhizobium sp. M0139]|uniref:glycosyl hydrolase 108 family protein n=1 Tax=Mesorhizobium sp. M0139 TaxID=2956892 RepID=UPI0033395598